MLLSNNFVIKVKGCYITPLQERIKDGSDDKKLKQNLDRETYESGFIKDGHTIEKYPSVPLQYHYRPSVPLLTRTLSMASKSSSKMYPSDKLNICYNLNWTVLRVREGRLRKSSIRTASSSGTSKAGLSLSIEIAIVLLLRSMINCFLSRRTTLNGPS